MRILTASAWTLIVMGGAIASARAQITSNPIPAPIQKRGLAVALRDVVRLPDTRGLRPLTEDVNPAGWARVSFVRDGPDGRRFANDSRGRLYLLDGSKALRAAVINYAGEAAFIQRCQVHKIRNVTDHLPESQRPAVKYRMRAAYQKAEAADARNALFQLHDELMQDNPSAAASLSEGMEETLTVIDLRLTPRLRNTLSSTNAIESGFSLVANVCRQVKRWQGSDHRLRWVGSALLFAESKWNKIHGYRHLPVLVKALDAAYRQRVNQAAAALAA